MRSIKRFEECSRSAANGAGTPFLSGADEVPLWMEFVLHGLAEYSRIGRSSMVRSVKFGDVLGSVLGSGANEEEEDEG